MNRLFEKKYNYYKDDIQTLLSCSHQNLQEHGEAGLSV